MSSSVMLALVTLVAPLAAALLSVVLPPIRHRGAPAAMLTILGSLLATGAAALLLMEDVAGRAIRATVPWMVVQGRGLGEVGVRLDAVSIPMLGVVCLVALAIADLLGRVHAWRAATLLRPLLRLPRALPLQHEHPGAGAGPAPGVRRLGAGRAGRYLLIGFHFDRPSAARAAVKAFWMTKLADMGFLFGSSSSTRAPGPFSWDVALRPEVAEAAAALDLPRRDGEVGAVPAARLAARRDGRPDAGLGADPRRDDGDGGRVPADARPIRCSR